MSRNIRILVAYDGSHFFGWQRQDGFESVQGAIEEALLCVTGEHITVRGSGRTDTGVHALGQVAHFHIDTQLDDNRLWHALNAHLARGAVVRALKTAMPDFHAQKSAVGKRYGYVIETGRFQSPFTRSRVCFVRRELDVAAMRRAAVHFVGEQDFSAMASAGSPRASNVRRIFGLHVVPRKTGVALVVSGNGFLYNMVRAIAGTMILVGSGRLEPDAVAGILASRERGNAGPTAAAGGLYMLSVRYGEPLDWEMVSSHGERLSTDC